MKTSAGKLTARDLFAIGAGPAIGVGWITAVGIWLSQAGAWGACLAFLVGGIAMFAIGVCYCEMARLCPRGRGEIDFALHSLGSNASFWAGWLLLLSYASACAFESISVGWIASLFVDQRHVRPAYIMFGEPITWLSLFAGFGASAMITVLNLASPSLLGRFQQLMVVGKLLLVFSFVAAGLALGDAKNLQPAFRHGVNGLSAVLVTTPFFLAGFNAVTMAFGESVRDIRAGTLALILMGVIAMAVAFYALVTLAVAMSLPRNTLLGAPLPAFAAFETIFGRVGAWIMLIGALFALLSAWNAMFYAASRVLQTLADRHFLPPSLGHGHSQVRVPRRAVIVIGIVVVVGTLLGKGAIVPILGASSTCIALTFSLVTIGTLATRAHRAHIDRQAQLQGGVPTIALACAVSISLALFSLIQSASILKTHHLPFEWIILAAWGLLGLACRPWRAPAQFALAIEKRS